MITARIDAAQQQAAANTQAEAADIEPIDAQRDGEAGPRRGAGPSSGGARTGSRRSEHGIGCSKRW